MSHKKLGLKLSVAFCALAAAGAAFAGTVTNIYGGGSSLDSPYVRVAGDCYGQKTVLVNRGTNVAADNPTTQTFPDFNYTGAVPYDCSVTPPINKNVQINYSSTGSGRGISGVFSHDPARYSDVDPATAGTQLFPSVQYGLSDTALGATDVNIYNHGGTEQGVTVVDQGVTPGAGQYANPREKYGALVQVPFLLAPVTIAYDPVYKKVRAADGSVTEYKFNINYTRADSSGGLRLDATTYCKIFNGQITNWNDPALKALNGNRSLKDPADPTSAAAFSVPMQIVGRVESSGTTSLFTRHLAAACASLAGNQYADATSTLPAALIGVTYDKATANTSVTGTPGTYVVADGNGGVAKYLDFTALPTATIGNTVIQGRIGYVGPDFALPYVLNTAANTYGLNTATLKNAAGKWVAPTVASTLASAGSTTPPDSLSNGHYDAGSADPRSRANPQDWVEPASKLTPAANPTAAGAYPIYGTSNFLGYTCYHDAKTKGAVNAFFRWYYTADLVNDGTLGLLAKSGFAPVPKNWRVAINETFTGNTSGLGLNLDVPGAGACTAATIVGG